LHNIVAMQVLSTCVYLSANPRIQQSEHRRCKERRVKMEISMHITVTPPKTQIHKYMTAHFFRLGTDTSVKGGGVVLFF
jgi:hypothetical protein